MRIKLWTTVVFLLLLSMLTPCAGQNADESVEGFVNRYIGIVDSGDARLFLPELVVSESEFMAFMEEEWSQKLSKARRKKMQAELNEAAEKGWLTLNRGKGSWISNGIFNEKLKFDPIVKTLRYYDIGIHKEKDAKQSFAQFSSDQITIISAKYFMEAFPDLKHEIFFPCVKTKEGKWKMIYKIHMRRI